MPMCACPKVTYESKAAAKAAKRACQRAAAEGTSWRRENRVYRCPSRSGWHLTSMPLDEVQPSHVRLLQPGEVDA